MRSSEKYGGKTIIIARFVPIVRTFAPFVAGVGAMTYGKFISYNVIGGVLWVLVCVLGGFYFGYLPFVKKSFSLVILAIVFISILGGSAWGGGAHANRVHVGLGKVKRAWARLGQGRHWPSAAKQVTGGEKLGHCTG